MSADPKLIVDEVLALGATLAREGATRAEITHVLGVVNELGAQYAAELDFEGMDGPAIFDKLLELVIKARTELVREVAVRELRLYRLRRPGPRAA